MEMKLIKREINKFVNDLEVPGLVKLIIEKINKHKKLIIILIVLTIIWKYLTKED